MKKQRNKQIESFNMDVISIARSWRESWLSVLYAMCAMVRFLFTYVTRTFPCRLMVERPCSVPRARLMTCCWGFGVTTTVDLAGCFLLVVGALRRNAGALLWWWCCCWACLNFWFAAAAAPPAAVPDWMRCCDLVATEQSFDWSQSVRAFASWALTLLLRPSSPALRNKNAHQSIC